MVKVLSITWTINIILAEQLYKNAAYKVNGIDAFICSSENASYTSECKSRYVEEAISGCGSFVDIGTKY